VPEGEPFSPHWKRMLNIAKASEVDNKQVKSTTKKQ
jgi:hypothetical protein